MSSGNVHVNRTIRTLLCRDPNKLTALLHLKSDSSVIRFNDLKEIFGSVLQPGCFGDMPDMEAPIIECLYQVCEGISGAKLSELTLEQKICMAIGIRLKAEAKLIAEINDAHWVGGIKKNQTAKLVEKYRKKSDADKEIVALMKRVTLMTPENIHLNSFMFEPILDMSGHHLVSLYDEVVNA